MAEYEQVERLFDDEGRLIQGPVKVGDIITEAWRTWYTNHLLEATSSSHHELNTR